MKPNYLAYILLFLSIIFRTTILNIVSNFTSHLFVNNNNLEIKYLTDENKRLLGEYDKLLTFKNNIKIESEYTITNVIKNSYGFNTLLINGSFKKNEEVINNEGLIGIIKTVGKNVSEVCLLHNTNLIVKVNEENGKIIESDEDNNLIVSEISNYNNIKINDLVYSLEGTYIGKVIKIKYDILNNYLTVKTSNFNDINYVAVISRNI